MRENNVFNCPAKSRKDAVRAQVASVTKHGKDDEQQEKGRDRRVDREKEPQAKDEALKTKDERQKNSEKQGY